MRRVKHQEGDESRKDKDKDEGTGKNLTRAHGRSTLNVDADAF